MSLAKYLHVVGAPGLFLTLGLDWASIARLRRARNAERVRERAGVIGWLRWLGPLSLVATLLSGLYMAAAARRDEAAWIGISLAALAIVALLGALGARRLGVGVRAAIGEEGRLSPAARAMLRARLPWISVRARAALLLGVVYLMTAKSGLGPSLWAVGVALLVAGAVSMLGWVPPAESAAPGREEAAR